MRLSHDLQFNIKEWGYSTPPVEKSEKNIGYTGNGKGLRQNKNMKSIWKGGGSMETNKIIENLKKSKEYGKIKRDLINQLKLKKAKTPTFLSQVNDYMSMWIAKEMLISDMEERGVYISYDNGGGQKGIKKNDSVIDQIKLNAQMLKLLEALDIKSTTLISNDSDEL